MELKKLQNGSDIRGIALDGVPGEHVNLTLEAVEKIAYGFGLWLSQKTGKECKDLRIGIGRDSRISGPSILKTAAECLLNMGISVFDCDLASTPAMFMTTVTPGYEYDGSIMVTASHLPYNRNGLKFFTKEGGLEKTDIAQIIEFAEKFEAPCAPKGTYKRVDFITVYGDILADKIRKDVNAADYKRPLKGFKIVVDAGNGAGGFYATILKSLGADINGSQFLEPDGKFPNHVPNPEDETAMQAIIDATLKNKADLGIIFDTDVDRAGAVSSDGKEINKNRLIALISAILLEEFPHTTIVTDSVTSSGLKEFIESKGGIHHRFKRGYKNVINESIRLNKEGQDSQLAIETSGHGALKENYFLDDGAYLITKIIIKMAKLKKEGKDIASLTADLKEPAEAVAFRMNIGCEDFKAYGQQIIDDLTAFAGQDSTFHIVPNNYEGIRVSFDKEDGDGWFLLRLSLHEPLIPLNIESDSVGGTKKIAKKLYDFLKKYEMLDIHTLEEYIR